MCHGNHIICYKNFEKQWLFGTYSYLPSYFRDHFVYASSQWETTLHCNVVSHWLDTLTKWSLVTSSNGAIIALPRGIAVLVLYVFNTSLSSQKMITWNKIKHSQPRASVMGNSVIHTDRQISLFGLLFRRQEVCHSSWALCVVGRDWVYWILLPDFLRFNHLCTWHLELWHIIQLHTLYHITSAHSLLCLVLLGLNYHLFLTLQISFIVIGEILHLATQLHPEQLRAVELWIAFMNILSISSETINYSFKGSFYNECCKTSASYNIWMSRYRLSGLMPTTDFLLGPMLIKYCKVLQRIAKFSTVDNYWIELSHAHS